MANKTSFFPTGSNCKIKINGVTLAYATNFSYSVSINHQKPRNLGSYEVDSFEPVSYDVRGAFTIIRYVEGLKAKLEELGLSAPSGVSNKGNGIGSWTAIKQKNGYDGFAQNSLNPVELDKAVTFDIEIYQKTVDGVSGVARLRNCRINEMMASIDKRSPMIQQFSFLAQYLDEDTFIADQSGVGGE